MAVAIIISTCSDTI